MSRKFNSNLIENNGKISGISKLTEEQREDILADRLAHLFLEQIQQENKRKEWNQC